ncbi:hypothetical protein [Entomohabitans teleogrylli]|uniref:hypothetical protein n=1 Tax=Entomohabitans teleogrylli TaxID=1384589 RepID=UPI00073D6FDF|nr:hypothetical protein [Entomohabitans teleogrylli]
MKINVASMVKNIVSWAFPLFLLGYLVYDDYRDNSTATEEQLLMTAKCHEKDKQLQALNNIAPGK